MQKLLGLDGQSGVHKENYFLSFNLNLSFFLVMKKENYNEN
jgi:hypothetical protein